MSAKRIFFASAVLATAVLVYQFIRLWYPTPPRPPRARELSEVEQRFPELRETLERVVVLYQDPRLREGRDSLSAAGCSLRRDQDLEEQVLRLDQDVRTRVQSRWPRPLSATMDIAQSDSLIYLAAWARRGYGFSAPSNVVGYVYASRDPGQESVWPPLVSGQPPRLGFPLRGQYRHLDGPWYLYSIRPPW